MAQQHARDLDELQASIAWAVLFDGRDAHLEKRVAGIAPGRIVHGIDIVSWAEALQRSSTREAAAEFLERLVAEFASRQRAVSIEQYSRLLDVVFAFGFHADVFARLRGRYAFHDAEPASAWRTGRAAGAERLYDARAETDALRLLGIGPGATPREIVLAYRHAAALTHPDRFHDSTPEDRAAAGVRFIAVVRAAELLLGRARD